MKRRERETMRIRRVGVIGAGVMGRGIAGLVASARVPVLLLDIPGEEGERNAPARRGMEQGLKASPPAFRHPELAGLVEVGNTEDDLDRLSACQWVVEAIPERPELKRRLYARLEGVLPTGGIVTTNTSGIPISLLLEGRSKSFRRHFFGTHFFNPPRVMHLLEVIPGPESDPAAVALLADFADRVLGKGIVRAKDAPGFIANRLGVFGIAEAIALTEEQRLGIGEVDSLTGALIGRPPSAVFRTADIVGLDVLVDTVTGIARATGERMALPPWVHRLVEEGHLGAKTGAGFYRKDGDDIRELDPASGKYRERTSARTGGPESLRGLPLAERLTEALALPDPSGAFLRTLLARTFAYVLRTTPKVAHDLPSVDRAMRWGFGWEAGPFEQMDLLGPGRVRRLLDEEELEIPALLDRAGEGFYRGRRGGPTTVLSITGEEEPVEGIPGAVTAAALRVGSAPLLENESAALLDMGDGVALLEFRSRMGTLGDEVVRVILEGLDWVDRQGWRGVVIGHDDARTFSAGANLKEVLAGAREGRWEEMDGRIRAFQNMVLSIRRAPFPVVAAPSGLTLAGGAEVVLHADQVHAHVELQIGLVEAGVGLLPAGGGTKELLCRFSEGLQRHGLEDGVPSYAARRAFLLIATAEVAPSGTHARKRGWLRSRDRLVANRDRLLAEAKEQLVLLERAGYVPPPERRVRVPGDRAFGDLLVMIQAQREAGRATPHDAVVSREIARVLCGGEGPPREMREGELMELEREAFLRLLGTEGTVARIEHMLKTGKPLRN